MTRRHNKVVDVIRRAIQENMAERLLSKIGGNTVIRKEDLSEEVQTVRSDLNSVTKTFGSSHTVRINISCLYRRIA
jgi:hypothetical protein